MMPGSGKAEAAVDSDEKAADSGEGEAKEEQQQQLECQSPSTAHSAAQLHATYDSDAGAAVCLLLAPVKDRILYDIFFHPPPWTVSPASAASLQSASLPSSSPTSAFDPSHYYEVPEAEYMSQRVSSYTASFTTREQLRRKFFCWRRRKPQQLPAGDSNSAFGQRRDGEDDEEVKEKAVREQLDDDEGGDAEAAGAGSSSGAHWPVFLSASSHLLAIVTDRSLILRSALTQYAHADLLCHPIAAYHHSRSPYASSQPSAHIFSSLSHPFSFFHSRPAAWYRDDMIALVVGDDTVCVYDVEPIALDREGLPRAGVRLVWSFSLSNASSPLERRSGGSGAAGAEAAAGARRREGGRKDWPTVAGLVWRDAVCHKTVRGVCPHLLVLAYDGSLHHVHVPSQPPPLSALLLSSSPSPSRLAFDARVAPHPPPGSSQHSRTASTSAFASPAASARSTLTSPSSFNAIRRRLEGSGHSRSVSSLTAAAADAYDGRRAEVATFRGIIDKHGRAVERQAAADGDEMREGAEDDETERAGKDAQAVKRRRKEPRADAAAAAGSVSTESVADTAGEVMAVAGVPSAFTSLAYDSGRSVLVVSSVSLSPDRSPQLSFWSVQDASPAPFQHLFSSPYAAPTPQRRRARKRGMRRMMEGVWKRIKLGAGLETESITAAGRAGAGAEEAEDEEGGREWTATLSDITSWLQLSPDGRRLLLLDVQGGLNVWQLGEEDREIRLIEVVRGERQEDGEAEQPAAASHGRGPLLCQVCWWDNGSLVKGFTDGRIVLTPLPSTPPALPASFALSSPYSAPRLPNLLGQLEQVPGIPVLSSSAPSHVFSPPVPPALSLPLPHRVFILSCHRRFYRKLLLWSQLGSPDPASSDSAASPSSSPTSSSQSESEVTLQSTFRLLSLCESSPRQFLQRKVEMQDWAAAERVCSVYGLDEDELWKERWKAEEVTEASVSNLMSKVSDLWWLLQQCATRSTDDVDKRRLLLQSGLRLTAFRKLSDLSAASASAVSARPLLFTSSMPDEGSAEEKVDGAALRALRLSPSQCRLCLYRLLFLNLLRRLSTYALLQQTASSAHQPLSSLPFSSFLSCSLPAAAADLARDESFYALEALMTQHAEEVWLRRLSVLAEVPLTTDPAQYAQLLPLSTQSPPAGESEGSWVHHPDLLLQLEEFAQHERDTQQQQQQQHQPLPLSAQHVRTLREQATALREYRADVAELARWYEQRMDAMDSSTGDLLHALRLCSLVTERDAELSAALTEYRASLEAVSLLVYEYGMEVSVRDWQRMSDTERLSLTLAGSTEQSIAADISGKASVVLKRATAAQDGSGREQRAMLLLDFITRTGKTDVRLVRGLVRAASSSSLSALLPLDSRLVETVLSSLYSCPQHDSETLQVMEDIVRALLDAVPISGAAERGSRQRVLQHVEACRILDKYGAGQPLSFFQPPSDGSAERQQAWQSQCAQFFRRLSRSGIHQSYSDREWSELLSDLLALRARVFPFLSLQLCYEQIVESALEARRLKLGKRWLRQLTGIDKKDADIARQQEAKQGKQTGRQLQAGAAAVASSSFVPSSASVQHVGLLPLPVADGLVLHVSRVFLDSSASADNAEVGVAKDCLNLLPLQSDVSFFLNPFGSSSSSSPSSSLSSLSTPELTSQWQQELDFIDGLQRLAAMAVPVIPYQLRTATNRLSFISSVLAVNPAAYTQADSLMDIARLLSLTSDEQQAEGRLMLLRAALAANDLTAAAGMAEQLLQLYRYRAGWQVALDVVRELAAVRGKRGTMLRLLGHAVWACEVERAGAVLSEWQRVAAKEEDVAGWLETWRTEEAERQRKAEEQTGGTEEKAEQEMNGVAEEAERAVSELEQLVRRIMKPSPSASPAQLSQPPPALFPYLVHHSPPDVSVADSLLLAQAQQLCLSSPSVALSHLLALSSPQSADGMLRAQLTRPLSRSSRAAVVSLAFRFFSLLALSDPSAASLPQTALLLGENLPVSISDDLLQQQVDAVAALNVSTPQPPALRSALYFAALRAEAQQADFVLSHLPGLELQRFSRDAAYRQSTILSLAHSQSAAELDTAVKLAKRYNLAASAVHLERLRWLLLSPAASVKAARDEVSQWWQQLMLQPADAYQLLSQEVFPHVSGRELERLLYVVSLCGDCVKAHELLSRSVTSRASSLVEPARDVLDTHCRVLDTLMKAQVALDYHALIDRQQTARVLSDVVTEENALLLAHLSRRLSKLVDADSPLPPFPPSPPASSGSSSPVSMLSPASPSHSGAVLNTLVTPSLVFRLLLSKSLKAALSSAAFDPNAWFDRAARHLLRLSIADICCLIRETASIDIHAAPPSIDRLMLHLTLVDLGLAVVDERQKCETGKPQSEAANADAAAAARQTAADAREYDAVIDLHEQLKVLLSCSQLSSLWLSPFARGLLDRSQLRAAVCDVIADGPAAGVQVKDVLALVEIVEEERDSHAQLRRPPSVPQLRPWSLLSLLCQVIEGCRQALGATRPAVLQRSRFNPDVLQSPVALCFCLLSDTAAAELTRIHGLLVLYTAALPATADVRPLADAIAPRAGDAAFITLALQLLALTVASAVFPHPSSTGVHKLPLSLSQLLKSRASVHDVNAAYQQLLLEQVETAAQRLTHQTIVFSQRQEAALAELQRLLPSPLVDWDDQDRLAVFSQLYTAWLLSLASPPAGLLSAFATLLLELDQRYLLDELLSHCHPTIAERQRIAQRASQLQSPAWQTLAARQTLLSSDLATERDRAAQALLNEGGLELMEDGQLMRAIASSPELLSRFATSQIFPDICRTLAQLLREQQRGAGAAAAAQTLSTPSLSFIHCTVCQAQLPALLLKLPPASPLPATPFFTLSLARLVGQGLLPQALRLLAAVDAQAKDPDVGRRLLFERLTAASKAAVTELDAESIVLYEKALQLMREDRGDRRVARPARK